MEISNLQMNSISAYKKLTKSTAVKKDSSTAKKAVNSDKIEFDFGRSLSAAKANVASRVDTPASDERLEELARLYAGDNCPVSARDVAGAMIG